MTTQISDSLDVTDAVDTRRELEGAAPDDAPEWQHTAVPDQGGEEPFDEIQSAMLTVQQGGADALRAAIALIDPDASHNAADHSAIAVDLQLAAVAIQRGGIAIQQAAEGARNDANYSRAVSNSALFAKTVADELMAAGAFDRAAARYRDALSLQPAYAAADDNLAVALLMENRYSEAEQGFRRTLERDRGLPNVWRGRFQPATQPPGVIAPAAAFKMTDRIDQLSWLILSGKLHPSFERLVDAHRQVLEELTTDPERIPYSPLTPQQLAQFGGYYDRLVYYRESPRLSAPALNADLDYRVLEEEYKEKQAIFFDNLLTPEALQELRTFFQESTVFFRHSEAGFVGSYLADGAATELVLQIAEELRHRLPNILGDLPLNNMWCYRYGPSGEGVRAHNGDGSVTLNFWLTDDDSNLGDPNGGGLVMYDKCHPPEWDWATINAHKDDPAIRAQIAAYLSDAHSFAIPYRCNRATLFHSTLFHKTDPFVFRDNYLDRRMNITMLFGRRAAESAELT